MTYSYLSYAITEMYCIVFAVTIWINLSSSLGSEHEVRQLRNMIFSYLVMLITDIFWAFTQDNLIHPPVLINAAINAATIMAVSCGCYFWFRFIEDRTHSPLLSKRNLDICIAIPLLLILTLDFVSIFNGWLFIIDAEGHYQDTPLFNIQTVVNYFYLLIPTVASINYALKAHSRQERSEYWTYALYMLAPLAAGILEETFEQVPLLALNIFMMILILFLKIQNMRISSDALTGLNNRRRLNHFLEESLTRASSEHPVLIFIMDINNFKSINDQYGHIEGDHALRIFADALKKAAARYLGFAARYGGDEFCLIVNQPGTAPEEVKLEIDRCLAEIQSTADQKKYQLTVSTGYVSCIQPENTPEKALGMADEMLYEHKKKWHELYQ